MAWFDEKPLTNPAQETTFGLTTEQEAHAAVPFDFGLTRSSEASEVATLSEVSEAPAPPTFSQQELDEAHQRGFDEARALLEAPLEERLAAQAQRHMLAMGAMLEQVETWRTRQREESRKAVIEIAGIFTRHLIERAIGEDPLLQLALAGQALERAVEQDNLRLQVAQDAVAPLSEHVEALRRRHPDHAHIVVEGDAELGPGDCRLVVDGGAIHGSLRERVELLVAAAREAALQHPLEPLEERAASPSPDESSASEPLSPGATPEAPDE